MIISRTPLRMSFVGGGSDLPSFYRQFGGAVLSTAIDKYVYVTINPKFDNSIRVSYSKTEEVESVDEIEHKLVRSILKYLEIDGGVEITSIADIPSRGTGLGSSSAFAVGLLNALYAHKRVFAPAELLAGKACHIEIDVNGEPIGKQDQYASAFGGLNLIEFHEDDTVSVNPIICHKETRARLEQNILVLYTGITRNASRVLEEQNKQISTDSKKADALKKMVQFTYDLRTELQKNNLDSFGEILHENWLLKRSLCSSVSTEQIDEWYNRGMRAGAKGGKLLGAGSGGFLMFYAPVEFHADIVNAVKLRPVKLGFDREGSKIIFVH